MTFHGSYTLGSRGYFFLISIFRGEAALTSADFFSSALVNAASPRNIDIRKKYPLEPRVWKL